MRAGFKRDAQQRLQRTRRERASLLSLRGQPLKRIYKASQEKKRIFLPGCRFGFVFFTSPHPNLYFSNQLTCVIASC